MRFLNVKSNFDLFNQLFILACSGHCSAISGDMTNNFVYCIFNSNPAFIDNLGQRWHSGEDPDGHITCIL